MDNDVFLMRKDKTFTIIELLVTIAIIAILAQLLIPALAIAKKKAREIKCMSNMKQTNSSINLYSEDFGFFPYGNSTGMDFSNSIKAYLWPFSNESSSILECGEAQHSTDGTVWISYAVHPVILPDFIERPTQSRFWKAGQIKRLSDTIIIMEACQKMNANCYPTFKSIPGIFISGVEKDKDNSIVGDFKKHDQDGVDTNEGWPRFRHIYQRTNAAFADGHATNIKMNSITEGNVNTNY